VPIYPTLSVLVALGVIVAELRFFRTGLFRQVAYWVSMVIVYAFMIPVDGWLTKLSAPIVTYDDTHTTGWRPVWDILGEEFVYAFALITLVMCVWDWTGRREAGRA
jgi:lycopene cyclase domain-containing protein